MICYSCNSDNIFFHNWVLFFFTWEFSQISIEYMFIISFFFLLSSFFFIFLAFYLSFCCLILSARDAKSILTKISNKTDIFILLTYVSFFISCQTKLALRNKILFIICYIREKDWLLQKKKVWVIMSCLCITLESYAGDHLHCGWHCQTVLSWHCV